MNINVEESECLNDELNNHRTELPKLRTKTKGEQTQHTLTIRALKNLQI